MRNLIDVMVVGYDAIMDHVESDVEIEQVGLLLTTGKVIRLDNESRHPSRAFEVSMEQMARALSEVDPSVETVAALYHSHPGGTIEPSQTDRLAMTSQWAEDLTLPWVILTPEGSYGLYEVRFGRVVEYRHRGLVNAG